MNTHLEHPPTALIVNDNPVALDLLRDLLEPEGYQVLVAQSAQRALEITSTVRTDVIISDVVMPEMDVIELCRRLKENPKTAGTPVLLVSAIRKEDAALREGFAAGADDYIEIPFRHEKLLVTLARLVERHRVERRYRDIVEQAVDIIYTRDMDGKITSINDAGARFFGQPAFELIGRPLSALIGDEAAAADIAQMQNIKSFEPVRFTSSLKNALGELRHLEGIVSLERDSYGAFLGVRGVVRDVTDQQVTAEAMRVSENRYRVVAETASDAIITIDESTNIVFANSATETIFGYQLSEIIGASLTKFVPDYSSQLHLLGVVGQVEVSQPQVQCQAISIAGLHQKGHEVPLEISFGQLFVAGRRVFTAVARDVTERQRAEEALQRQNEEYRILFESNPCPMYVCAEGSLEFLAVNQAAVKHYGYSREEFLAMSIKDIRPREDIPQLHDYLAEHPERNDQAGAWKHLKKDGSVIDVEVSWQKLDFAGRHAYMVMANDITEQKQVQIAMRDSEERYRELFQNANDIIYTIDLAGNFTSLNQTGERLTGYTQAEALLMNIAEVVVPEHLDFVRQNLARKIESNDTSSVYETEIAANSGQPIPLQLSSRLIYQNGKPVGVQGIARDISARRGAEEALKDSEEKFRSIVETTNEWIWAIDLEGTHSYTNPAIQQILGYKTEEVLGANVLDFVHLSDRGELEKFLKQRILEKRGWTGLALRWRHKHEGYRDLESSGLPVFDAQGKLAGDRGANRDITEQKLAEEALNQQAERAALTNRISQAVRRTLEVSEVFETAVRELGVHLEVDRCSLFMKDEKAGRVTNAAEYHVSDVHPAGSDFDLPQVQGLNAAMEKHGILAFDDVANDERVRDLYQVIMRFDVKSIMYVGVTVDDQLLGAFALSTTRQLRHWSEADIEVAKAAADQTGIAIRQARLYQKAAATSMREALVNKLSVAIRASLSLTSVLNTATRELGQALSASRVEVRLYEATGDQSFAKGEYVAAGCESVSSFDAAYDELLRGHFLTSSQPLVISDTQQFAEGAAEFANCIRLRAACTGARSQIDYPLTLNGEFLGVISIHQTESVRGWSEDEG